MRPLSLQCRYLQGLKAVFVYIQDRGFNGVADNTSLSARTRAFIQSLDFDLNIWFRSRKVTRMRLRETGPRRTPSPRSRYTVNHDVMVFLRSPYLYMRVRDTFYRGSFPNFLLKWRRRMASFKPEICYYSNLTHTHPTEIHSWVVIGSKCCIEFLRLSMVQYRGTSRISWSCKLWKCKEVDNFYWNDLHHVP